MDGKGFHQACYTPNYAVGWNAAIKCMKREDMLKAFRRFYAREGSRISRFDRLLAYYDMNAGYDGAAHHLEQYGRGMLT